MKHNAFKVRVLLAFLSISFMSASALAEIVNVTINNPSDRAVSLRSASSYGFPNIVAARKDSGRFQIYVSSYSSSISADYASGLVSGGCRFEAGHTTNTFGPVYSSSAQGYGGSVSYCSVSVREKWSPPYNYSVEFTIYL